MPGRFISFEGGEGCGKSTQISLLKARLDAEGREVVQTREPGGTALGESIRHLLQHDKSGHNMTPEAELLLFAASRAQHVRERIAPAINAGAIVLCDRFMDSTTVYQGVARSIDATQVDSINRFAVGPYHPDLTILIDLPPEIGLARIRKRGNGQLDRMEQETIDFYKAIRQGYLSLAHESPERFVILDGTDPVEDLESEIWEQVQSKL
jgi:dTMP kinase